MQMNLKLTEAAFHEIKFFIFNTLRRVMYLKMEAGFSAQTSVYFHQNRLYVSATCLQQLHLYI